MFAKKFHKHHNINMQNSFVLDDSHTAQKIMAVLGALCVLYFLFVPLQESRHSSDIMIYLATGNGIQWPILVFAMLAAALAWCRVWYGAFVSSCALLLTLIGVIAKVFLKNLLVWIFISNLHHEHKIYDFFIFKFILRYLFKLFFLPVGPMGYSSYSFESVSLFQTLILFLGVALLWTASFWGIRVLRYKNRVVRTTLA